MNKMKLENALIAILASTASASPIFWKRDGINSTNSSSNTRLSPVTGEQTTYLNTWSNITFPEVKNCNVTQVKYINKYYQDMLEVLSVARSHLIEYNNDSVFKHWFGNGNPLTVLGVLDNIASGSKDGVLYRCDDIEGECASHLTTYPGYHRSDENATGETVLCDLFFTSKKPLEDMCVIGSLIEVGPKKFAGVDLFHRFLHIESINKGFVGEYTEEFEDVIEYSKSNSSYAVINTDSLLYYITEAYSVELTGDGCLGEYPSNTTTHTS